MPTIGHFLFSYVFFRGDRLRWRELGFLMFFSIFPDFDIIVGFLAFGDPFSSHRTFTHSFLFVLLFGGIYLLVKQREALFAFAGVATHVFLDSLDNGGVPLLFPFSSQYFGLGLWSGSDVHDLSLQGLLAMDNFMPDKIILGIFVAYLGYLYLRGRNLFPAIGARHQ